MIDVAVLGSSGMLGHVVVEELRADPRFNVRQFCRMPIRLRDEAFEATDRGTWRSLDNVDYVVNCIGLIKQHHDARKRDWYAVNSIFPWLLADHCSGIGAKLIHISTDCVFSGTKGDYTERDEHDAVDDYGVSKSLGEPDRAMVLRTSVIGKELKGKLSFLEWAISMRGKRVSGYENHRWNGLTSLEYARVCRKIVLEQLFKVGVFHVHSDPVSKHELLTMIDDAYGLWLDIAPTTTPEPCYRTLKSVEALNGVLGIPSLARMIDDMARRDR